MQKVILDISMSLDGYVAGPDISEDNPLGLDGPRLHDWMFASKTDADASLLEALVESTGAVILGGWTYFTAIDGVWEGISPFHVPAFVLTNGIPEKQVSGFIYVTGDIDVALAQARAAAGSKNVWIMGGAQTAQEYLKAGLIDELHIHIAPILLAAGTPLFEDIGYEPVSLEKIGLVETPGATHLRFRVLK